MTNDDTAQPDKCQWPHSERTCVGTPSHECIDCGMVLCDPCTWAYEAQPLTPRCDPCHEHHYRNARFVGSWVTP